MDIFVYFIVTGLGSIGFKWGCWHRTKLYSWI